MIRKDGNTLLRELFCKLRFAFRCILLIGAQFLQLHPTPAREGPPGLGCLHQVHLVAWDQLMTSLSVSVRHHRLPELLSREKPFPLIVGLEPQGGFLLSPVPPTGHRNKFSQDLVFPSHEPKCTKKEFSIFLNLDLILTVSSQSTEIIQNNFPPPPNSPQLVLCPTPVCGGGGMCLFSVSCWKGPRAYGCLCS